MSTELTPPFEHRTVPTTTLQLEEQFGHLQFVIERDNEAFVFRLKDEDADALGAVMRARAIEQEDALTQKETPSP